MDNAARQYLTNEDLAEMYLEAARHDFRYRPGKKPEMLARADVIIKCPFNIHEYYEEHSSSLDTLRLRGLGTIALDILEMILKFGLEHTVNELKDLKIEVELRKVRRYTPTRRSGTPEPPPSWDNILRKLED